MRQARAFTIAPLGRGLALCAALLLACGGGDGGDEARAESQPSRCDLCGMRVDPDSGWRAGGELASAEAEGGRALTFDAPKCLFRHHHTRGAVSNAWVIEYYAQERRPAAGGRSFASRHHFNGRRFWMTIRLRSVAI